MICWDELFYYNENSPSKLTNKVNRPPRAMLGENAGYMREDGYWLIGHNKKNILVHRIIYEMFYGEIEKNFQIDHIDGNPSNNSITNLRKVTSKENQQNMKLDKRNTSGNNGVHYLIVKGRQNKIFRYWSCAWKESGKQKTKRFSIDKYGDEKAKLLAIEYRKFILDELNNNGENYSERHGT